MSNYIEWDEPFGTGVSWYTCRALKDDIIKYMKEEYQLQFKAHPNYPYKTDEEALQDFMVIHWARECDS